MESFCKSLYKNIRTAQADMVEHARLKLRTKCRDVKNIPIYDLPHEISSFLFSSNTSSSLYLPANVVEVKKIDTMCKRITSVIPESTTRIDVFFLTGEHCVKGINHRRICDIIELYVRVLEIIAPTKRSSVQIAILPTVYKKQMDFNSPIVLGARHVNSGVTFKSSYESSIIVFRHEELYKVLLHELLHLYDFDYFETNTISNAYRTKFTDRYKIESAKLGLNESFNDALTLALYIGFFIAIKEPHHMESKTAFVNAYLNNFNHLRSYLVKMSAKLSLYAEKHFDGVTHETSHIFAYYHGKAALFANSSAFFMYIKYNKYRVTNISKYIRLLYASLESKVYKDMLAMFKEQLSSQRHNNSSFFYRTLRMCNFDLEQKN